MSIGPFGGVAGSAAGAPLSQTKGSETEKTQQQASAGERQVDAAEKSARAAGIGATEEDQQTSDRDADGRRLYDEQPTPDETKDGDPDETNQTPKSKDATGSSGNQLDLMG